MNYPWLEQYLLAQQGVTSDYKSEWNWQRYMVGEKMFAATMRPSEKHNAAYANKNLLNLKCDPSLSESLRAESSDILPGFYIDKRTWIAVNLGGTIPDELLKQLIDNSYQLVFQKLTKKLQRAISSTMI